MDDKIAHAMAACRTNYKWIVSCEIKDRQNSSLNGIPTGESFKTSSLTSPLEN